MLAGFVEIAPFVTLAATRIVWIAILVGLFVLASVQTSPNAFIRQLMAWGKTASANSSGRKSSPPRVATTKDEIPESESAQATSKLSPKASSASTDPKTEGLSGKPNEHWLSRLMYWRVPKSAFKHFYALATTWNTVLLGCYILWSRQAVAQAENHVQLLANPSSASSHHASILEMLSLQQLQNFVCSGFEAWPGFSDAMTRAAKSWIAPGPMSSVDVLLAMLMLEFQVVRRHLESQYLTVFSDGTMHAAHYVFGLLFYVAAPWSLVAQSPLWLGVQSPAVSLATSFTGLTSFADWYALGMAALTWRRLLAIELFVIASYHQFQCHRILAGLRTSRSQASGYFMPHGDWFEWCGSPHYLAEILVYLSLSIMMAGATDSVLCFFTVVVNLSQGARLADRWYRTHFPGYSKRVLLPRLW
ncbi:hypothetical protein CAOG_02599 [Capsaspora owczarzaki ATCC 30864]|uniref:hypothetical protein n=1 Tax=Capsaspora owczarzaki (strain ATCC 30864) TaxID=595528 RepID=UPI0001FE29DC|nr:hypothetical protein CAOG_02599 [Capsaspora owczarzaki ATCC 30864]|eukprot:XP_004349349.1 hypothetical protein CAOG_02599 [Capsaspora owczarzaki ATCC 30864]